MQIDPFSTTGTPVTLSANGEQGVLNSQNSAKKIAALTLANIASLVRHTAVVIATAFARPADTTAYASGDLVANSTTAGSVAPVELVVARKSAGICALKRVQILKSGTGVTNAAFRVHFYKSEPTAANGDNGAWSTTASGYIGSLDVTVDKAFSDGATGAGAATAGQEIAFQTAANSKSIYALVEARGAYTPASAETFTLTVEVEQRG
jgi:hypothetical protein